MSLKFYDDERRRWPQLVWHGGKVARIGPEEAEAGIRRLASHFGISLRGRRTGPAREHFPVSIRFASGNRRSTASRNQITINLDWADWLVVAHEVAHTYWYRRLSFTTRAGHNAHGRRMAAIVDRFAAWILEQGWHEGSLAHELAVADEARVHRQEERERTAATPEPIDARIARRCAQVKRLETKMRDATLQKLEAGPTEVVEVVDRRYGLREGEKTGVLQALIEGADLSRWGLANAVTRASHDVKDYDRAIDLERLGGQIIELPPASWAALSAAKN